MYVVILGCGRVGARVAATLSRSHRVTVIDTHQSAFDRLPPEFAGETVVGNGIDVDDLRAAGVERADLFLALTHGDNRNLMAGQIAKQLGVERVVTRVYDPDRSRVFEAMGLTTVCPTVIGADRLFGMVTGEQEGG